MNREFRFVKPSVWTSLTAAGLAAGLVAGLLVGMLLGGIVNAMIVTASVTCCVGTVLGAFQALGLRQLLARPFWWILATLIGVGVGLAAAVVTVEQIGIAATGTRPNIARLSTQMRALSFVTVGIVTGAILGVAQALVLRRQIPRVKYWAFTTAAGLAIAFSSSSLLVDLSGLGIASPPGVVTFVLISGLAFGILTSWPLHHAA